MLKKALASSVNEETIAYFFFPRLFGITSGFSRDFAENREIWGLNREKASKIVSLLSRLSRETWQVWNRK
jgi:hypothetical protein